MFVLFPFVVLIKSVSLEASVYRGKAERWRRIKIYGSGGQLVFIVPM